MELSGATIVVTGASSGIGRQTCLDLASRGANVVAAARRREPLETLAAACRARNAGGDAIAVPTDVADAAAVEALGAAAVARFGRIDGWVNAAAVSLIGRFEQLPPDAFRRTHEVNFFGMVNGCRTALRELRRTGRGTIVNVASMAGRVGLPYYTAYGSAKHAVVGFSQSLRMDLAGTGIEVCTVMPAAIDTPLFQHSGNVVGRAFKPIRPFYAPELVAGQIVGLLERPRGETNSGEIVGPTVLFRTLAPGLFERTYRVIVERDHFLDEPAAPTLGNVFEPMAEGTTVDGGWSRRQRSLAGAARLGLVGVLGVLGLAVRGLLARRDGRG